MKSWCFLWLLATVRTEKVDPLNPTAQALARWKAAHVQALKKREPVDYQVRNIEFYALDVDTPGAGPGPATSAVIGERTTSSGGCTLSIAKFACKESSPDADRFTCSTTHLGEHYDFSWRRTNGAVYIGSISGELEN